MWFLNGQALYSAAFWNPHPLSATCLIKPTREDVEISYGSVQWLIHLRGVEWVHCLFLFPLVLGKTYLPGVLVTCKIGSFLCSLDNLLHKNTVVFFFENQISKWCSFEKRAILTYFSHFLVTREKLQKFLQHISHSHIYMYFAHPIDFFCLTNFEKIWIYQVWFLFGMSPGVDSYLRHFRTINK